MAVSVRASAAATLSQSLTLPTGIVSGDIIVLHMAQYQTVPTLPTGYTSLGSLTSNAGTYAECQIVGYKVADGTEGGTTVTGTMANYASEASFIGVVVAGGTGTPVASFGAATDTTTITTGSITAVSTDLLLGFFAEMTSGGGVPTFTVPTGTTVLQNVNNTSYHRGMAVSHTGVVGATTMVATSNQSGSSGSVQVQIAAAPPITVRGSVGSASASLVIPAATQVGDLIVLMIGASGSALTLPSGYTSIDSGEGVSTTTDYHQIGYKIAVSGDAGSTVTYTGGTVSTSGFVCVVLTGVNTTTPFRTYTHTVSSTGSGTLTTGSITAVATDTLLVFFSAENTTAIIPTFTLPALTLQVNQAGTNSHRVAVLTTTGVTGSTSYTATSTRTAEAWGAYLLAVQPAPVIYPRTGTDSISGLSETTARQSNLTRATQGTTVSAPADTSVGTKTIIKSAVDSISLADSNQRLLFAFRSAQDFGVQYAGHPGLVNRLISPVFSFRAPMVADSAASTFIKARSAADDVSGLTDLATRSSGIFVRNVSDSAPASDVGIQQAPRYRTTTDDLTGLMESATRRVLPYVRGPPDNISGLADAATRVVISQRSGADSTTTTDAAVRSGVFHRVPGDATWTPTSLWTANYYANSSSSFNFSAPPAATLTQTETAINYNWGTGNIAGSAAVGADNVIAVWTATHFFGAGTYTFQTISDDGIRVYIDGTKVIDAWYPRAPNSSNPDVYSATLTEGNHTLRVEYFEAGGGAVAQFWWAGADQLVTADSPTRILSGFRSGADSTSTTEAGSRLFLPSRSATDATSSTDTATAAKLQVVSQVADSAPTTDSAHRGLLLSRSATDAVAAPTDGAVRSAGFFARNQYDGSGMVYRWFSTNGGNPVDKPGLDADFVSGNGVALFQGTGVHSGQISWHETTANPTYFVGTLPSYLPGNAYSWEVNGYIEIPTAGTYGFMVDSDDASDIWIDDVVVGTFYNGHDFTYSFDPTNVPSRNSVVTLSQGVHKFRVRYEQGYGGHGVVFGWKPPGAGAFTNIPASAFTPLAEYATRQTVYSRTAADSTTTTDAATRADLAFRTAADSTTTTDAVTSSTTHFRAAADSTAALADTATRVEFEFRSPADAAPASDSDVRQTYFFRGLTESLSSNSASISTLPGYVWQIDAANSASDSGTDPINNLGASTLGMLLTAGSRETLGGIKEWNLDSGYLDYSAGSTLYTLGQNYTIYAWVYWRASDSGWRTLHRGDNDHWILVEDGSKRLGMYSNRNGGFRPSGYNIDPTSGWNLVTAVGYGDGPTATTGRTEFYINGEYVGQADRVGSGTTHNRIGWPGQGPGRVAEAGSFPTTAFTPAQVKDLFTRTRAKYGYATSDVATRQAGIFIRSTSDGTTTSDAVTRVDRIFRSATESTTTTDAPTRALVEFRTASDATTTSDAAVRALLQPRTAVDSTTTADVVASPAVRFRTATDAVTPTDVGIRVNGVFHRALSDSTTASDAVIRLTTYARYAKDLAAQEDTRHYGSLVQRPFQAVFATSGGGWIGDAVSWNYVTGRNGADSLTTTDAATRVNSIFARTPSDTAPATDADLGARSFFRSATDTVTPSDAASRLGTPFARIPADSIPLGDAAVGTRKYFRSATDATSTADAASRVDLTFRSGSDATSTTDLASQQRLLPRNAADATTTTDAVARQPVFFRAATDSTTTTDSATRFEVEFRTTSETTSVADLATRVDLTFRTSSDSTTTSDSVTRVNSRFGRTPADTISTSDAAVPSTFRPKTATDSTTTTDLATRLGTFGRTPADTAPATDADLGARSFFRSGTDSVAGLTDTTSRQQVLGRTTTDIATPSDAATRMDRTFRTASDSTATTDAVANARVEFRTATDNTTTTDAVSRSQVLGRALADATSTTDTTSRSLLEIRSALDATSTSDAASRSQVLAHGSSDSTTTTDDTTRAISGFRTTSDSTTSTDSATRSDKTFRTAADATSTSDTATRSAGVFARTGSESAPATDVDVRQTAFFRTGSDTVTPADAATRNTVYIRSTSEATTTADSVSRATVAPRSAADSTTTSDVSARFLASFRSSRDQGSDVPVGSLVQRPFQQVFTTTAGQVSNDQANRSVLEFRSAADAAPSAETVAQQGAYARALAETIPVAADVVGNPRSQIRSATDAITTTDTAVRQPSFFRSGADTFTTTDAVVSTLIHPPVTSDSVPVPTDAASRQVIFARSATDTAPATDAAVRYSFRARTATDTQATSDLATRVDLTSRSAADATSTSESASRVDSLVRTASDAAPATDASVQQAPRFRTTSDTVTSSDAVSRTGTFARAISDSTSTADSVASTAFHFRTTSDSVTPTEAATRFVQEFRTASDSTSTSDSLASPTVHFRTATDSTTTTDSTIRSQTSPRTAVDSTSTADSALRQTTLPRLVKDEAGPIAPAQGSLVSRPIQPVFSTLGTSLVSDSASGATLHFRSTADSTSISDTASRTGTFSRSLAETTSVVDVAAKGGYPFRAATDSLGTFDAVSRSQVLARALTETLTTSDAANRVDLLPRTSTDSTTTSDGVVRQAAYVHAATDFIPLTDAAIRFTVYLRTPADSTTTTDSATGVSVHQRTASDSLTVSDAASRLGTFHRTPADSSPASDSDNRQTGFYRGSTDTVTPADAATRSQVLGRAISDAVTSGDAASRLGVFGRSLTEATSISDVVGRATILVRSGTESLTTSDSAARSGIFGRSLAESTTTSDVASETRLLPRSGADSTTTSDSVVRTARLPRTPADAAPASDAGIQNAPRFRTSSDTITPSDVASRTSFYLRSASEAAPAVDSVGRVASEFRTASESAPAVDSATRALVLPRSVADNDTQPVLQPASLVSRVIRPLSTAGGPTRPYDAAFSVASRGRTATDSTTTSDTAIRPVIAFLRTAVDAAPATDTAARQISLYRTSTEIVTPSESASRSVVFGRTTADATSTTDSQTHLTTLFRSVAESTSTSDAQTHLTSHVRTPSDAAPANDATMRTEGFYRTGSDVVTPSDVALRANYLLHRSTTDAAPAVESVSAVPPGKTSDSTTIGDGVSRTVIYRRSVADTVTPTETTIQNAVRSRTTTDSASAIDSAVRAVVLPRSAADTATPADATSRSVSGFRVSADSTVTVEHAAQQGFYGRAGSETVTPSDNALRIGQFSRTLVENVTTTDVVSRVTLLQATCVHVLPIPVDQVLSQVLAIRTPAETAPASDDVTYTNSTHRTSADVTSTSEVLTHQALLIRHNPRGPSLVTDAYDPPVDHGLRVLLAFRGVQDVAPINDVGIPVGATHIRLVLEVLPVASDVVTSRVVAVRVVSDTSTPTDGAQRHLQAYRSGTDQPGLPGDSGSTARSLPRQGAESTTISDAVLRILGSARRGGDGASVTDEVARHLSAHRDLADVAPSTDALYSPRLAIRALADLLPTPADLVSRYTGLLRSTQDANLPPHDAGWWAAAHKVHFGPPIPTITSISQTKVGNEPGCDTVTISFTFDQPVDQWQVRINSTGPFDGAVADHYAAERLGFGLQSFGRYPFGESAANGTWTTAGTATIHASMLLHGDNDVVVYGRSLQGIWSFLPAHPVQEPVGAR